VKVTRSLAGALRTDNSISAVLTPDGGSSVDLGRITSPYADRIRNWLWKQWKYRDNCRRLDRMDRYHPLRHATGWRNESGMATVFTNVGKNWVADKCRDTGAGVGLVAAGEVPNRVAWGTGAGTALVTDTTLFTEASEARALATLSGVTTTVTGDTLQAVGTITADGTKTVTNGGWFSALTGPDMLGKGDFSGVPVALNDAIEFTWRLQFQ
jgi:hypothetical protein